MSEYILTPQEQAKLDGAIQEAVDAHIRISAEKEFIKDVADRVKEELGFKSAQFNALVGERFDNKSSKAIEKHEEIIELSEMIRSNAKSQYATQPSSN